MLLSPPPTTSTHTGLAAAPGPGPVHSSPRVLARPSPCQEHPPLYFTWPAPPSHTGLQQGLPGTTQQPSALFLANTAWVLFKGDGLSPLWPLGQLCICLTQSRDIERVSLCAPGLLAKDSG